MNVVLWIAQAVLAVMFGMAGVMKPTTVRLIGVAELAGALGLILPALAGIAPILTPLAAPPTASSPSPIVPGQARAFPGRRPPDAAQRG